MSKNQKKLYKGIFITIVFSIIISFFVYTKEKEEVVENIIQESTVPSLKTEKKPEIKTVKSVIEKVEKNTQSVTILTGNTKTYLSFLPNTLFYDALTQAKNAGKIEFAGKNYPGLGFFVTDIGSLHAGNGKSLLYYVNGKEATVGVSLYTLKDGDIIEWKLE